MSQNKLLEIMQNQDFRQAMQMMMLKNIEDQKKSTLKKYQILNQTATKGQIVLVGSSSTEYFPIGEMQLTLKLDHSIYNRGIGATITTDLLNSMDVCIFDLEPSKIFINIGSNDIGNPFGYNKELFLKNYDEIMKKIKERLPECLVYVTAYYPVNAEDDFSLEKFIKDVMFATRTKANL